MDDRARVAQQLGREPQGAFEVVIRDDAGDPVVVRNAPFLDDGTPMPTRYYLVGPDLVVRVSRLEAAGGVRRAEADIPADDIAAAHTRYAADRDAAIDDAHVGPRPSGGVGGTRTGVKCLHAHLAYTLAGGDDPVGRWTIAHLDTDPDALDTGQPRSAQSAPETGQHTAESAAPSPDELVVRVEDRHLDITVSDGGSVRLPIGPLSLVDGPLEHADPPTPEHLTNALGLVRDHLDDAIIAAPSITAAVRLVVTGSHALALARTEIGSGTVPDDYRLTRADIDEVFRTVAVEPAVDRIHNPGLDADHVDSIVATCCVILGIMRRLDLDIITVNTER